MISRFLFWIFSAGGILLQIFGTGPDSYNSVLFLCLGNLLILAAFAMAMVSRATQENRKNPYSSQTQDDPAPPKNPRP